MVVCGRGVSYGPPYGDYITDMNLRNTRRSANTRGNGELKAANGWVGGWVGGVRLALVLVTPLIYYKAPREKAN